MALTACSSADTSTATEAEQRTPEQVVAERADVIVTAVPSAVEAFAVETDAGEATAAMVIHDDNLRCPEPIGIECGVLIEIWDSEETAAYESGYDLELQKGMSNLLGGAETHELDGAVVLRVNADLPGDVIEQYRTAFTS